MDGVVAGTPEARFTTAGSRAHARWRDSEPVSAPSGTWADFWRPPSLRGGSGVRPTSAYAVRRGRRVDEQGTRPPPRTGPTAQSAGASPLEDPPDPVQGRGHAVAQHG